MTEHQLRDYCAAVDDENATLRAVNAELVAEVEEWRSCAKYDAMMDGPRFKAWDRSQMDRCRKRFIDAVCRKSGGARRLVT